MTTALTDTVEDGVGGGTSDIEADHTNVFVLVEFAGSSLVIGVYGPFSSREAAKDWGLVNCTSFTVAEIMRPYGVEDIAFILKKPHEPTLEDQGIHPEQAQIGDYIDPDVVR